MGRKYFGTDGIRGRTNVSPMTADIAMKVGQAAGAYFLTRRGYLPCYLSVGLSTLTLRRISA